MAERRRAQRDRQATTDRLVEAVGVVLARDGFRTLGVNAVANEAGVDKVLIYRYFGGLPELLRAFGERGGFWPTDDELTGGDPDALLELDPSRRWATVVVHAVRAIRSRPLTHEILAWEMVESNELTRVLEEVREAQFERLMTRLGSDVDVSGRLPTAVATSIAATNYLLARARHIETFAGLDLRDETTWARLEAVIGEFITEGTQGPALQ